MKADPYSAEELRLFGCVSPEIRMVVENDFSPCPEFELQRFLATIAERDEVIEKYAEIISIAQEKGGNPDEQLIRVNVLQMEIAKLGGINET